MLDLLGSMDHTSRIEPSIRRAQQCMIARCWTTVVNVVGAMTSTNPASLATPTSWCKGLLERTARANSRIFSRPTRYEDEGNTRPASAGFTGDIPGILTAADFGFIRGLRSRRPENAIEETLNQLGRQFCCGVAGKHPLGEPGDSRQNELGVEVGIH